MPERRIDTVILGAGIAGSALAYHLAPRAGPILLADPRPPAAGATGRAAGVVTLQLWNEWDVRVTREARAEYAQLAARHDPSAFSTNGFVRWTSRPDWVPLLEAAAERLRGWGVDVRPVPPDRLHDLLPAGRFDGVVAAVHAPDDAVVTPSRLAEIYLEEARRRGAEIAVGTAVGLPVARDGGWEIPVGGQPVRARRLVVAAGAWSKRLLADLGHPLPLAPYPTQAAVLAPPDPVAPTVPSAHDLDEDVYTRPEANGRILAGNGTRLVEVDPDRVPGGADDAFLTHLAETFGRRFPGWADADLVRAWAGICTATPDRRPLVGAVPGAPGLHVLVGFNGFGVMRAGAVAARLAARLGSDDDSAPADGALAPVDPARFPPGTPARSPRPGFTLEDGDDPRC